MVCRLILIVSAFSFFACFGSEGGKHFNSGSFSKGFGSFPFFLGRDKEPVKNEPHSRTFPILAEGGRKKRSLSIETSHRKKSGNWPPTPPAQQSAKQ